MVAVWPIVYRYSSFRRLFGPKKDSSDLPPWVLVSAPYNSYWPMDFSLGLIREQKRAGVVLVVCLTLTFRVGLIEKPAPVCWVLGPSQLSGESLESAWLVKNVINALLYRWMTCFFLTQMVFSRCYPVGRTADMELDPLKLPPQRTDSKMLE